MVRNKKSVHRGNLTSCKPRKAHQSSQVKIESDNRDESNDSPLCRVVIPCSQIEGIDSDDSSVFDTYYGPTSQSSQPHSSVVAAAPPDPPDVPEESQQSAGFVLPDLGVLPTAIDVDSLREYTTNFI
jgi:hypothetical protein